MPKQPQIIYRLTVFLFVLLSFTFMTSCGEDNPLDVDVSGVEVSLTIDRMEEDLFSDNISSTIERNKILLKKYGPLYEIFMTQMIGEGSPHDANAAQFLASFVEHPDMLEIYGNINKEFLDFTQYQDELIDAFKHYKYHFPDSTLPRIVTFYSNFNANAFPYQNTLGIGLDMYLGSENELVKSLPPDMFPQYFKDKMEPEYLVYDAMKAWLMNRFADQLQNGDDFLSKIVTLGKVMYLMDAMFPRSEDYLKFGCTSEQLAWCKLQEVNIWKTIVDENVLYNKDQGVILQYVSEGPFTKGMPHESPAKVGVWLGWQIVRDYMEQKPETTIKDLLEIASAKKILKSYSQGERE